MKACLNPGLKNHHPPARILAAAVEKVVWPALAYLTALEAAVSEATALAAGMGA
jgi:hypothetical protein